MRYEDFLTNVRERAMEIVGEEGKVSISHIIKNNGMELDGLVIMMNQKNVSPTIYLNNYYEEFECGRSFESIIEEIMLLFDDNKDRFSIGADYFLNFENIRDKLVYKLINFEQNQKLLEKIPHKRILDLAMVYYCLLEQGQKGNATVLIYNTHVTAWNIDGEKLHEIAMTNTPKLLGSEIKKMADIIRELLFENVKDNCEQTKEILDNISEEEHSMDMFVLTNKTRINGAACMLYDSVLGDFANSLGTDLYILPSSIHEVIILPKVNDMDKEHLCQMVKEVNAEGVAVDEILSDQVYTYNRLKETITL